MGCTGKAFVGCTGCAGSPPVPVGRTGKAFVGSAGCAGSPPVPVGRNSGNVTLVVPLPPVGSRTAGTDVFAGNGGARADDSSVKVVVFETVLRIVVVPSCAGASVGELPPAADVCCPPSPTLLDTQIAPRFDDVVAACCDLVPNTSSTVTVTAPPDPAAAPALPLDGANSLIASKFWFPCCGRIFARISDNCCLR